DVKDVGEWKMNFSRYMLFGSGGNLRHLLKRYSLHFFLFIVFYHNIYLRASLWVTIRERLMHYASRYRCCSIQNGERQTDIVEYMFSDFVFDVFFFFLMLRRCMQQYHIGITRAHARLMTD
ncbi:hypothetical protein ACJX0J_034079, partial [Zea mays]